MPRLKIHHKQGKLKIPIPYWVFINGQPIGFMRDETVEIQMPEGTFNISIRLLFRFWKWGFDLSSDRDITLSATDEKQIEFSHDEPVWDTIFNIDLVLWFVSLFFTIPHPWNIVYHVLSDGFFAIWLLRNWIIRKCFFKMNESDINLQK